jgi:REP element-mobilizing transposase RayT
MPRPVRIQYAGAVYQVMRRGDRREAIFADDGNREMSLGTLGQMCVRSGVRVHNAVLTSNHCHLLLETAESNPVAEMKWFHGTYTQRLNVRHRLSGHLFVSRSQSAALTLRTRGKLIMRIEVLLMIFAFCQFSMSHLSSGQTSGAKISETELSRIQNEIETGDGRGFEEAAKLRINEAVDLLAIYALGADKARSARALEVLRDLPGLSAHMKQRLLSLRSKPAGEYDMPKEFDLLVAVGGERAAAATAPFLFVSDAVVSLGVDYSTSPVWYQAVKALSDMHLPDRPVNREYFDLTAADVEAWKRWAKEKGYNDDTIPQLMTFKEKGVPTDLIAQSYAASRSDHASSPAAAIQQEAAPTTSASSPVPAPSSVTRNVAESPAAFVEREPPVWLSMAAIVTVLVIVALALKRRR